CRIHGAGVRRDVRVDDVRVNLVRAIRANAPDTDRQKHVGGQLKTVHPLVWRRDVEPRELCLLASKPPTVALQLVLVHHVEHGRADRSAVTWVGKRVHRLFAAQDKRRRDPTQLRLRDDRGCSGHGLPVTFQRKRADALAPELSLYVAFFANHKPVGCGPPGETIPGPVPEVLPGLVVLATDDVLTAFEHWQRYERPPVRLAKRGARVRDMLKRIPKT